MHDRARPRLASFLAPSRARRVDVDIGIEHGEACVVVDGGSPHAFHEPVSGWCADAAAGVFEECCGAHDGVVVGRERLGDRLCWRRWLGGSEGYVV